MSSSPRYRADIDGLRGVAVLAVVAFHTFPSLLPGGFAGVDVFFVISGFLITGIIRDGVEAGTFSFAGFYARRARRIVPALAVVLAVVFAIGAVVLYPVALAQLGSRIAGASLFVVNFQLARDTGYFATDAASQPLLHLWSLAIEEQFYLLWPGVLVLVLRFGRGAAKVAIIAAAVSFTSAVLMHRTDPITAYFVPWTRLWEPLLGCALALAPPIRAGNSAAAFGVAALALSFVSSLKYGGHPGLVTLFPTLGACSLIMAEGSWINRRLLAWKPLVGMGLISYPLYLWHWPLLSFMWIVVSDQISLGASRLIRVGLIGMAVLLSIATYLVLERRIRFHPRRWHIPALAVSLVLIGALGLQKGLSEAEARANDPFEAPIRSSARCAKLLQVPDEPGLDCDVTGPDSAFDVIIGDSHATAMFPAIAEANRLNGRGTVVVGGSGCFAGPGVATILRGRAIDLCTDYGDLALRVATRAETRRVFLVQRWATLLSGRGFGSAEGEADLVIGLSKDGGSDSVAIIRDGLEQVAARLRGAGKSLYVVYQVPELPFSPSLCDRHDRPRVRSASRLDCSVSRNVVDERQRPYRELLAAFAAAHPDVRMIDPLEALCDSVRCRSQENGLGLYKDSDHLQPRSAKLLSRLFGTS